MCFADFFVLRANPFRVVGHILLTAAFPRRFDGTAKIVKRDGADEDRKLLAAVGGGDVRAFERLHQKFYGRLFGFTLRLLGRRDLADEVVNDTMMVVWRRAGAFEGRSAASTWIFAIAYRTALKARSRTAREALHDELEDNIAAEKDGDAVIDALFDAQSVARALSALSTEQRAIVELTYRFGYRLGEIAEVVGCPVGTVKSRMFAARTRMRGLLGDHEGELEASR